MKKLTKQQELYRKEVAKDLAKARVRLGVTQQELAEKLNTQKSNISRFESGEQNISLDYVISYADALNLKPVFMMEDETEYSGLAFDYELKLYDTVLLSFSLSRIFYGTIEVEILSVNEELRDLFPVSLDITPAGIKAWLKTRCIPKNRAYVTEILRSLGLEANDIKGIIDTCLGLSLNDSYWITPVGSSLKYDKNNLYDNTFDEALALVAFVGMQQRLGRSSSPEFTTGGTLRKGWRIIDGEKWLYKGGAEETSSYLGLEPFSEYYAYQVARAMNLFCVEYDLSMWKGILSSRCKLFTTKDISFVSAGEIKGVNEIEDVLSVYSGLNSEYYDQLCDMLVFDALVYNTDRHFGNFGLLRDNKTGKYIGVAPIFDNGMALFPHAIRADFDNLDMYCKKCNCPYERSWEQILDIALGKRQKEKLKALKGFRLEEHPLFNLPEWRMEKLNEFLQERVKELLRY